ncbi:glycerophosphodiester phosphodiesterase family protein [Aquimonas voraii]|uniref:glycerophosphodiester phosphodiesterase n=1 Tax=Aquimonas voraii TaxID=265719 RepID=A0A1G6S037_9GAMM|nr:glycerophosphodiester phosphodiesterase family protein [Aquimonas voraii]SDD10188.1 glycerophosphoryl diester phosphodiesterase [Aquimonas voraii]
MSWKTLDAQPPQVIAHRGASGVLPEHTLAAYALGLGQGADVIEPDLVPTRDGALIARHEPNLARSTDVFDRGEFSHLKREGDWWSTDLALDEIRRLRARQPFEGRSDRHDGHHAVPGWQDVIDWAAQAALERGQTVRLYPELKHPAQFTALGLDPVALFAESVRCLPGSVEVRVQCFEIEALRRVHEATRLPCTLLLEQGTDWRAAIAEHGAWLWGVGVDKRLLWSAPARSSGLVEAAHAAGLRVHPWTYRDDRVGENYADVRDELRAALRLGVDGVFCDFPATGIEVRESLRAVVE